MNRCAPLGRRPVALVTGASSGLGREFARLLAGDGHDLVLTARRQDRLKESADEVADHHGAKSLVLPADLCDAAAPEEIFAAATRDGWPIDVLVNNAGVMGEGRLLDHPWPHHEALMRLKILSPFHLVHLFLPAMLERRNGGVTFTAVCPGATRTEMYDRSVLSWTVPKFLTEFPEKVARRAWTAAKAGRPLVVGGLNGLSMALVRRLPEALPDQLISRWLIAAYDRRPHAAD